MSNWGYLTLCASSSLDRQVCQPQGWPSQYLVYHHPYTVSRDLGCHSGHQPKPALGVVLGEMQLFLHLGVDGFTDQSEPVLKLLFLFAPFRLLVHLCRCQEGEAPVLLQEALERLVIVCSVAKEILQVVWHGVQKLNEWPVVIRCSAGEQIAQDNAGQTYHRVELDPEILHCQVPETIITLSLTSVSLC